MSLPVPDGPLVSPDGRWLAWTWSRAGPVADVYAAPADGSSPPTRLTETPEDTALVSWTPDSRSVLVSQDQGRDERSRLFRVSLSEPCILHPLTEPRPAYFLRGGQLHPNGRWLFYGANWDEATGSATESTWLYRHDLVTGERRPLARPQRGCYYEPALNDLGTHLLYQRCDLDPAGRQLWMVDVEGREDRQLYSAGPTLRVSGTWLAGGERVLLLAETDTHYRVGVVDPGLGSVTWLIDDPDRCIEQAFIPHGSRLGVVLETRQARTRASLLDPDTGAETALETGTLTLIPIGPVDRGCWAGTVYSSRQPHDLVRFMPTDLSSQGFASLAGTGSRTPLSQAALTGAEEIRWRSVDGLEIQGWLYRTPGPARGTVVHVHGGPEWHVEDQLLASVQYLVAAGFHVLVPNYRGSTGFGRSFREAIKVTGFGGLEQEDIRAGIETLLAAGVAQPGRVGITGTSYGGYSAWHALTHWPMDVVAAAAPVCGMTDLAVDWETTRPDLRPLSEAMMGGRPADVPERYHERSPVHFVDRIRGRLLIVQGMRDPNVHPQNVKVVRAALDRACVPYELLAFEDEGHGVARPANQKLLYRRLAQFFASAFEGAGQATALPPGHLEAESSPGALNRTT